jgi:hypothetical protein
LYTLQSMSQGIPSEPQAITQQDNGFWSAFKRGARERWNDPEIDRSLRFVTGFGWSIGCIGGAILGYHQGGGNWLSITQGTLAGVAGSTGLGSAVHFIGRGGVSFVAGIGEGGAYLRNKLGGSSKIQDKNSQLATETGIQQTTTQQDHSWGSAVRRGMREGWNDPKTDQHLRRFLGLGLSIGCIGGAILGYHQGGDLWSITKVASIFVGASTVSASAIHYLGRTLHSCDCGIVNGINYLRNKSGDFSEIQDKDSHPVTKVGIRRQEEVDRVDRDTNKEQPDPEIGVSASIPSQAGGIRPPSFPASGKETPRLNEDVGKPASRIMSARFVEAMKGQVSKPPKVF